jgi:hypothetical protein
MKYWRTDVSSAGYGPVVEITRDELTKALTARYKDPTPVLQQMEASPIWQLSGNSFYCLSEEEPAAP